MGFNINLLFKCNEIFSNKIAETASEEMLFRFFYSLEQITTTPTETTDRTAALIDHVLTSSSYKVIQSGVIDLCLSNHKIILDAKNITTTIS